MLHTASAHRIWSANSLDLQTRQLGDQSMLHGLHPMHPNHRPMTRTLNWVQNCPGPSARLTGRESQPSFFSLFLAQCGALSRVGAGKVPVNCQSRSSLPCGCRCVDRGPPGSLEIGAASFPAGVRRINCGIAPRRNPEQAEAERRWLAARNEAMKIELLEAASP